MNVYNLAQFYAYLIPSVIFSNIFTTVTSSSVNVTVLLLLAGHSQ